MLTKKQRIRKTLKRWVQQLKPVRYKSVLFIAGAQRSGTNFLADVLDRSVQTACFHENDEEAFHHYELRDNTRILELINHSRARLVVFKSICDSQRVDELLTLWPDSRCLWAFRNYTDVINSALNRFSDHGSWLEDMLFHPEKARWRVQNVSPEDMERVRYFYNKGVDDMSARALIWYLRNSLYFQQNLDRNPRVRLVRYEMLVTRGEELFPELFRWLDLKPVRSASKIAFATSIGKQQAPDIDPQILGLCDSLLKDLDSAFQRQWEVS